MSQIYLLEKKIRINFAAKGRRPPIWVLTKMGIAHYTFFDFAKKHNEQEGDPSLTTPANKFAFILNLYIIKTETTMKNYAVLTYETPRKGKNANGGLSVHIERRPGYSKANIDPKRTHLNQLVHGSPNIDEAVNKRIEEAGITRKIRKDAVLFKQLVLSGTPPHINDVLEDPSLGKEWIDTSLKFLFDMFGKDNVVNVTLHMDEHSPHLHATIVPILYTAAKSDGRPRKTNKRYKKRDGVARLSAKDMFDPERSEFYQDEYAARVAKFGFERGERKAYVRRLVARYNREHPKEAPIPLYKPNGMGVDEYYRFVFKKVGYLIECNDAISQAERKIKTAEEDADRAQQAAVEAEKKEQAAKRRLVTAVKAQITQLNNLLGEAQKANEDNLFENLEILLRKADARAAKLKESILKLGSDNTLQQNYHDELKDKVDSLLHVKNSLEEEWKEKVDHLDEILRQADQAEERLKLLMDQVSDFEMQKADLDVKIKVASVLTVSRLQELLYYVAEMPCDDSVLSDLEELIKDLKIRDRNTLIELERLLFDIIFMLLSLLFRSVSREFLLRFSEPVTKRFGFDFEQISYGDGGDLSQMYANVVDRVANEKIHSDAMMSITFKESNVLIDNPEKRNSKQYLLGLIAQGHWESIIKNIQDSVPDQAETIMKEILETLNEPAITNAYQQRLRDESEYRRKGYFR